MSGAAKETIPLPVTSHTMLRSLRLSERDEQLLEALSFRVRVFSMSQVSTGFFADEDSAARRRLRQLSDHGLINTRVLVSRSLPIFEAPLLEWAPGDPAPRSGRIAAQLQRRWSRRRTKSITGILLGKNGAKLFGVAFRAGPRHPLHIAHDLALSSVYVRYLARRPELALSWIGEDSFATRIRSKEQGGVVPDAMVIDSASRPILAIELGGLYSERRIATIHRSLSRMEVAYEIW